MRYLPILAAVSGLGASIEAGLPVDPGTLDAFAKWPLTVILGAVCVVCVFFMYWQGREHSRAMLEMIRGEREATKERVSANALVTKELAENNAKQVRELAETHAKEIRTLLDEILRNNLKGQ